ncbi:MAG: hypothetical protein MUE52_07575 [Tabrizicola sp.]|jgi:hypothetical protein|nr:hypothetical protein [Tabrizicola sp.]
MRREIGFALALLAGPVAAEETGCDAVRAALEALSGYQILAASSAMKDGWCILDGTRLQAGWSPDLQAATFRLRGVVAAGEVTGLELETTGLQIAPRFGQRDLDPILRETLRLKTADLSLELHLGPEGLLVRDGRLQLSGGTELDFEVSIAGAGLSAASLALGRLTLARLDWRNDGRLLRPALEAAGQRLAPEARGAEAIDAVRSALSDLAAKLPASLVADDSRKELGQLIHALPHGRGTLAVEFRSEGGLGAAQIGLAALADDPMGSQALAWLFSGAQLSVDWEPGLGQ